MTKVIFSPQTLLFLPIFFGTLVFQSCSSLQKPKEPLTMNEIPSLSKNSNFDWIQIPKNVDEIPLKTDQLINRTESLLNDLIESPNSNFETFVQFEQNLDPLETYYGEVLLLSNTHPNSDFRKRFSESKIKIADWFNALLFNEKLFKKLKNSSMLNESRTEVESRLVDRVLLGFKRQGLDLPKTKQIKLKALFEQLEKTKEEFQTNIRETKSILALTKEELKGVPDSVLAQIPVEKDKYQVPIHNRSLVGQVLTFADNEFIREKISSQSGNYLIHKNKPVLTKIAILRAQIAKELGYETWADYVLEENLAKNRKTVFDFYDKLLTKSKPLFEKELKIYKEMKSKISSNPFKTSDFSYFKEKYIQENFKINSEELKNYFEFESSLQGMFRIYEKIFGFEVREIQMDSNAKWHEDVRAFGFFEDSNLTGVMYLDPFPREGKYGHFAIFPVKSSNLVSEKRNVPIVAMVTNFNPKENGKSYLTHNHLQTLFHEFGHAVHGIVSKSIYRTLDSNSVPKDFVEAPSQMLEYWVFNADVLNRFAKHKDNPNLKISQDLIDSIEASTKSTKASFIHGQASFGKMDFAIHGIPLETLQDSKFDLVEVTNQIRDEVYLPGLPNTNIMVTFGHMTGYSAGYYGYLWAEVIAADMASIFENSSDGFLDEEIGLRLRKEIYEMGTLRDMNQSIEAFLGRPLSFDAFLKELE